MRVRLPDVDGTSLSERIGEVRLGWASLAETSLSIGEVRRGLAGDSETLGDFRPARQMKPHIQFVCGPRSR